MISDDLQGLAALASVLQLNKEDHPASYEMLVEILQREADRVLHPRATAASSEPDEEAYTAGPPPATPSFEEVWGSAPPGLARSDFEAALKTAGYDSGARGFAQWGAQDWEHLSIEERQDKMAAVHQLINQAQPLPMRPFSTGPSDHASVLACPSGENHGEAYQNRTREGKPFYKCRNPQCHRPGQESTTTWDDSNYSKRQEEFRTGQPYQPAGGQQWRGRRG